MSLTDGAACGQFSGRCSYLVEGSYPTAGQPRLDTCVLRCDCYSGKWSCKNSCACPGSSTSDPYRESLDGVTFQSGCLHPDMRCDYDFEIGKREDPNTDVATQACRTTYTCSATSWNRVNKCFCPAFTASRRFVASQECHSDPSLTCAFPPNFDGGPARACRCENERWSCE